MIRPFVFRAALAVFAILPSFAQETTPAPLTLEECVARALNKNFDLQLQQFSTLNAREDVIVADAIYDPTLFATTALAGSKTATLGTTTSIQEQSARLGVSQRLVTGAEVTASTSLARSKERPYSSPPLFNPVYNSDLSLSLTQPLLQGFGVTINRATIERARLGVTRANYDFKAVVLAVIRNVESAYYNLAFAREQLAVRKLSLTVAQTLLDENNARLNTGVATNLEVLQSEVGVANARRDLLLAQQSVTDSEDALLDLIGRFEFNSRLGPVVLPDVPAPEVSFERSYALALANAPDYAASKVFAEQLKLDLAVAKNNRLPAVDLGAAVGYNGNDRDNAGGAFNSAASGDAYNWQVDLTVSIPWGLRAERARYRQALTNLNRQETFIQSLDQSLLLQVRSAVRAVETSRETVDVSALATRLSEKQFETEKARYEAGLSTYRFVEDSRQDMDTARVNELLARVNLRIALAELARLEGTSLEHYEVKLEE
ncbi:MAG: transporter [Rariglobus sp.]|jgi:outer membrane protein TolC|nr:transporter [Rariglobus sp.]